MKRKFKITIDGAEREIEIDVPVAELVRELPAEERKTQLGMLTREEIAQTHLPRETFEAEMTRRVNSATQGYVKLDDLPKDEKLRQKIFDLLGVKISADGKPQLTADQVAQLQKDWREKELAPAVQRAEKAESRIKGLLNQGLSSAIVQAAAAAGVHEHMLKPPAEGQLAPIVAMLAPMFKYSDEHDAHFVGAKDGFAFSADPQRSGSPYKGVTEFVTEWAASKDNSPFINAKTPGGPKLGGPGGPKGGAVTIEEPSDRPITLQEYQAASQEAGEGGRVVVKTAGGEG